MPGEAFAELEMLEPRLLLSATISGIELVSLAHDGAAGNNHSFAPAISADGRYVAFVSAADNLVPDDNNNQVDVFVYDRVNETIERVSVGTGGFEANERSVRPSISADGRYVVFESLASNLSASENNATWDVFLHDRLLNTTEQISVDSAEVGGNQQSGDASVTSDGRYVVFTSSSTNLVGGDGNAVADVFVRDRVDGVTIRISEDTSGLDADGPSSSPFITSNGQWVVFTSLASDLVDDDTNGEGDIFRYEMATGVIDRVSVPAGGGESSRASNNASISEDGRYIAFESFSTDFVAGDADGIIDVFVKDMVSGAVERISRNTSGVEGNGNSTNARISGDGNTVVFESFANDLVANDTNFAPDVFAFQRDTQTMIRVSTDAAGNQSLGFAINAVVSADGQFVAFDSDGDDLTPGDSGFLADVFLAQLPTATVYLPGDFDGSGTVDTQDINPFILALTNPAAFQSTYGVNPVVYDTNNDGVINTEDINPFILILTGGGSASGQSSQTTSTPASEPTTALPAGRTVTARSLLGAEDGGDGEFDVLAYLS